MQTAEHVFLFRLSCPLREVRHLYEALDNRVNATPWLGHESETCRFVGVYGAELPGGQFSGIARVAYCSRGWQFRMTDRARDGTLLDGEGCPLPEGGTPVELTFYRYLAAEFNDHSEFFQEPVAEVDLPS